jgi:hypothetical protein
MGASGLARDLLVTHRSDLVARLYSAFNCRPDSLRALMEFAKNDLIFHHALFAQSIYQVCVLAVQPAVPSLVNLPAQPIGYRFAARLILLRTLVKRYAGATLT